MCEYILPYIKPVVFHKSKWRSPRKALGLINEPQIQPGHKRGVGLYFGEVTQVEKVEEALILGQWVPMVAPPYWTVGMWGFPGKWMVYFMENPVKMHDDWGSPPILGNLHVRWRDQYSMIVRFYQCRNDHMAIPSIYHVPIIMVILWLYQ